VKLRSLVVRTIIAALCCVGVGAVVFQGAVVNYSSPRFAFVVFGVVGSIFFFALRETTLRNALALLVLLFALFAVVITRSLFQGEILGDVLFFIPVPLSVFLFFRLIYTTRPKNILNPLFLAAFVTSVTLVVRILHTATTGFPDNLASPPFLLGVLSDLLMAFLLGLGIGVGIEVTEHLHLEKEPGPRAEGSSQNQ
jgi:hypothetical protein